MKFSTRMKGRIPEKAIEYLLAGSGGDTGKQGGASAEPGLAPHIISQEENKSEKERTKILGGEHAVENNVCEVLVAPNLLQQPSFYVMECAKKKGSAQLLMRIPAWLSNGEKIILNTLVDTGAEVNLVRLGLLPDHLFFSASKKLKLLMANGNRLSGGERIINTEVAFTQMVNGVRQPTKWWCNAEFYEADIKVDAILSYPWMVDNEIGVLPYRKALVVEHPCLTHLFGLDEITEIKKGKQPKFPVSIWTLMSRCLATKQPRLCHRETQA